MRLAIIGSRNATQFDLSPYLPAGVDTIVSGGARGIDSLASSYAKNHNIHLVEFLPEYDKYGRGAPLVRNKLIIDYCDAVLAFWDGQSRGTKYTIDYAKKIGKPVTIIPLIVMNPDNKK